MTKDGRYLIRAYRKDEYIVVEGEVVETGVAFSLTYEYNRFKELFAKKSKEQKALEKEYNQKQKEEKKEKKAADKKADSTATVSQSVDQPVQSKSTLN